MNVCIETIEYHELVKTAVASIAVARLAGPERGRVARGQRRARSQQRDHDAALRPFVEGRHGRQAGWHTHEHGSKQWKMSLVLSRREQANTVGGHC